MFARFATNGPITQLNLWSRTGLILTEKSTDEPGEGTMMKCDLQIPGDAHFVELWFMNSGDSGHVYFDSDYGRNYRFEFTTSQLEILDAWLVPRTAKRADRTTSGEFHVRVAAAQRVTAVSVSYFYWLSGANPPVRGNADLKSTGSSETSRRIWESDPIPTPNGTAVNFDVEFVIDGRPHIDDNGGRHYLVPDLRKRSGAK